MKVLLLSPHTDDVELGAGGTLIKLIDEGIHTFKWVVFSDCKNSVPEGYPVDQLRKEFYQAAELLQLKDIEFYDYPNRRFTENRQNILEDLITIRNSFRPDLVIGPATSDCHQDHTVIAQEMFRAFKIHASILGYIHPWNHIAIEKKVFFSLTEFQVRKKIQLLNCYETQIAKKRPYFSEDYFRGMAIADGVQCNSKYAEGFELIKWIVK